MLNRSINRLLAKAAGDREILAVILAGSQARGEASEASDMDICLVLAGQDYTRLALSQKKLDYLAVGDLDVLVFQQLPLFIRRRILREGKVLFVRDEDQLYDIAFRSARAFEDFRHIHQAYLEAVARAGS